MKVIISAAGTAGHINPALAIANKIKQEEKDSEIIFIGTEYGLENELVTKAGYELKKINAYGFSKKLTFENLKRMFQTITSIFTMKKIIKEFNPDIVIGTGGYICGPTFYAAGALKVPMLLHESNGYPGMAVKMFDGKAKILLGFENAKKYLKHKENVVTVGNPTNIRKVEFSKEERKKIFKQLGLDENIATIVVTGGSQGARKLNESILELIKITKDRELGKNFQIIFATGKNNYDEIIEKLEEIRKEDNKEIEGLKVLPYIFNMEEILNISDLAICRSGAMTVTEMLKVGIPAIFIPLPSSNSNKQSLNAEMFVENNMGKIIENNVVTGNILYDNIMEIILEGKIKDMKSNIEKYIKENENKVLNTLDNIYNIVKDIVKEKNNDNKKREK